MSYDTSSLIEEVKSNDSITKTFYSIETDLLAMEVKQSENVDSNNTRCANFLHRKAKYKPLFYCNPSIRQG